MGESALSESDHEGIVTVMTPPQPDSDHEAIRARLHRLNDIVQAHEGTLREYGVRIEMAQNGVDYVRATSATRDQVDSAMAAMTQRLEHLHSENALRQENFNQKLDTLQRELQPIKKGVYAAIGIILAAVLTALLTLVINGPPPKLVP